MNLFPATMIRFFPYLSLFPAPNFATAALPSLLARLAALATCVRCDLSLGDNRRSTPPVSLPRFDNATTGAPSHLLSGDVYTTP